MPRYTMDDKGQFLDSDGKPVICESVEADRLQVSHLLPHIIVINLPDGRDVKILIEFSCHCWTVSHADCPIGGQPKIMDGIRARAFNYDRYQASLQLGNLFQNLLRNKIYLTPSDRNFAMYNARFVVKGSAYFAFFTAENRKGRHFDDKFPNGIRHAMRIYVESAYMHEQPSKGTVVKGAALIGKTLKGEKIKYRRG